MTADIEVRAKRRFEDMKNNNPEVTYSDVLENLSERDSKDSNRKDSPLRVADEAIVIDTSDLEINEQTHKIIEITLISNTRTNETIVKLTCGRPCHANRQ